MANYRQIHVSIWKDEYFLDLNSSEKLLFIYLFSNELASLSGLYKLPKRVIEFETGLKTSVINATLQKFEQAGKVFYENGIVWVLNLRRYNRGSSKVDIRIQNDILEIPDCPLKEKYKLYYQDGEIPQASGVVYDTDTVLSDADTVSDEEEIEDLDGEVDSILEVWKKYFPNKPQPRKTPSLKKQIKTRLKDRHFRMNWYQALRSASEQKACVHDSWFTLRWVLRNDNNYQRLIDKEWRWKDKDYPDEPEPVPESTITPEQIEQAGRLNDDDFDIE